MADFWFDLYFDVINLLSNSGAEGQSRTDTELPPPVFETGASTISPLRHVRWYYTICLLGFGSASSLYSLSICGLLYREGSDAYLIPRRRQD